MDCALTPWRPEHPRPDTWQKWDDHCRSLQQASSVHRGLVFLTRSIRFTGELPGSARTVQIWQGIEMQRLVELAMRF
jgi:hypothetical protein